MNASELQFSILQITRENLRYFEPKRGGYCNNKEDQDVPVFCALSGNL